MEKDDNSSQLTIIPDKGRGLQVSGGQILLPVQERVEPGCPKFYELVRRTLGKKLGQEVVASLQSQEQQHTRATKICLGLIIILVVGIIFYCWPKLVVIDTTGIVSIDTQTPKSVESMYGDVSKQVEAEFKLGNYQRCQELVAPSLDEILETRDKFKANGRLVHCFLDCQMKKRSQEFFNKAQKVAKKAQELDPDALEWTLFALHLEWQPFIDSCLNYDKLIAHHNGQWYILKFQRLNKSIKEVERRNRNLPEDRRLTSETLKSLRLTQCQILTALWLLRGQPLNLPDDYGDAGVEHREEAYSKAKQYPDDIAFLNLRLFLAETVYAGLIPFMPHKYRFDGNDYYDRGHLNGIISDLQSRIETLQEVKP